MRITVERRPIRNGGPLSSYRLYLFTSITITSTRHPEPTILPAKILLFILLTWSTNCTTITITCRQVNGFCLFRLP